MTLGELGGSVEDLNTTCYKAALAQCKGLETYRPTGACSFGLVSDGSA